MRDSWWSSQFGPGPLRHLPGLEFRDSSAVTTAAYPYNAYRFNSALGPNSGNYDMGFRDYNSGWERAPRPAGSPPAGRRVRASSPPLAGAASVGHGTADEAGRAVHQLPVPLQP